MTTPPLSPEQQQRVVSVALDLAREGRTGELVEVVDRGLPVDTVDADGNSLLMLAAHRGQRESVEALLARGADVDLRNARGQSILAAAIFKGEDGIARRLVAAGADPDAGTPSGRQAAEMFGRVHVLETEA